MSVLTLELPVELVVTLEAAPAPTLQPTAWLPAAVEALQAFRQKISTDSPKTLVRQAI